MQFQMKLAERSGGDASICVDEAKFDPFDSSKNTLNSRALLAYPPLGRWQLIISFQQQCRGAGGWGWIDGTLNIKRGRLYWGLSDGERGVNIVPD